jgi:hypothetical protein
MQEINRSDCGCGMTDSNRRVSEIYHHMAMADAPLAMAYVPDQSWEQTYEPCRALLAGTIFPGLYKPFCGKGGACL